MLLNTNKHIKTIADSFQESPLFPLVFILTITLFSFVVAPGYESFSADQTMFLPPLLRSLDPSLFSPEDLEHARMLSTEWSLVDDVLGFFIRQGIPLLWVLFLLSLIIRISFFAALYYIIFFFTEDRARSTCILLFFLLPFFIPGTGHATFEETFTYRMLAVTCGLVYIALTLAEWRFLSSVPLIFAFTLHAVSAVPFFAVHAFFTMRDIRHSRNFPSILYSLLRGLLPFLGAFIFLLLHNTGAIDSFFLQIDEEWKQLANPRNAPAFFAFWDTRSYISLIGWITLLGMPLSKLRNILPNASKQKTVLILVVLVPLCMLAGAFIGELTLFYGIVKLNLQRGLLLVSFFTPLLVGMWAFWNLETNRNRVLENVFLISLILWFLFKENFIFLREQFLIFLVPLAILWYWRMVPYFLKNQEKILSFLAVMTFGFLSGAITQRSLAYGDTTSLIWFYAFLLGGISIGIFFYVKKDITPTATIQYGIPFILVILLGTSLFSISSFTIYPAYYSNLPYREACAWIGNNTPKDSIFIVEPFVSEPPPEVFRLACLRSIFTTYKEGGVVPYDKNRETAFEWKKKYDLIRALPENPARVDYIKQLYRTDYLISESPVALPTRYPLVFSNDAYYIYDIHD